MEDEDVAKTAIATLNESEVQGRKLIVNESQPLPRRDFFSLANLFHLHSVIRRWQRLHNSPEQLFEHENFQIHCKILPGQDRAWDASLCDHILRAWGTIGKPCKIDHHVRTANYISPGWY